MRYGGEVIGLQMRLSIELEYLFQNKYLDSVRILLLLKEFHKRTKGLTIEEIVFWTSLIEALSLIEDEYILNKTYLQEIILLNEERIKEYLMLLANQELINIRVEKNRSRTEVFVKIAEEGKSLVSGLENSYFLSQRESCKYAVANFKYNVTNRRKALSKYEE